mmetsp:Transcript_71882/g.158981  ORF Transcript_71882/g.158981 Transcript_71882/m.158981 type:complete len:266 (-) Transcript_71882:223-1020(-)
MGQARDVVQHRRDSRTTMFVVSRAEGPPQHGSAPWPALLSCRPPKSVAFRSQVAHPPRDHIRVVGGDKDITQIGPSAPQGCEVRREWEYAPFCGLVPMTRVHTCILRAKEQSIGIEPRLEALQHEAAVVPVASQVVEVPIHLQAEGLRRRLAPKELLGKVTARLGASPAQLPFRVGEQVVPEWRQAPVLPLCRQALAGRHGAAVPRGVDTHEFQLVAASAKTEAHHALNLGAPEHSAGDSTDRHYCPWRRRGRRSGGCDGLIGHH